MREEDLTIFDYRREKEIKNTEAVLKERLNGKFEKGTVRTKTAGYIDFQSTDQTRGRKTGCFRLFLASMEEDLFLDFMSWTVLIVKSWRIWLDVW